MSGLSYIEEIENAATFIECEFKLLPCVMTLSANVVIFSQKAASNSVCFIRGMLHLSHNDQIHM